MTRPEETDYGPPCLTVETLQVIQAEAARTEEQNKAILQLFRIHDIETKIENGRAYAKDEWIDGEGIDLSDWVDITEMTLDEARKWLGY